MTTAHLIGQEAMVLEVLQEVEAARSDDYILFAEIIERFYPEVGMIPFRTALVMHNEMAVPSYESITRVRRKVQRKFPELASERAKARRERLEGIYKEYARS
jgi:hypothetical protein